MSVQMETPTSELDSVRIGMPVYDSLGDFVGYVLYTQKYPNNESGFEQDERVVRPDYDFAEDILEHVFHGDDLFTDELMNRLREFGYLCIVNGNDALDHTRYFVPGDDISYVATGTVFLALPEPLLLSSEND
ncbi:MAG: hypothetical protein IT320_09600 [Anaerolineae bacterium]|nr:hypothetical protein [Anaerolineae bacterium]